jgi:uncharacterized protein YlxP (DUF503 family)
LGLLGGFVRQQPQHLAPTTAKPKEAACMALGLLNLHIHLPGCSSLKEKRSRIKPLLARLHKEFNVSVAEIDLQDVWQDSVLACAYVSNDTRHTQERLQRIAHWIEANWPDVMLVDEHIEII